MIKSPPLTRVIARNELTIMTSTRIAHRIIPSDEGKEIRALPKESSIPSAVHHPVPLGLQPPYARLDCRNKISIAHKIGSRGLPRYQFLNIEIGHAIIHSVLKAVL